MAEQFKRDGFLHVRGLLTPAEVERYRVAVDEAVATRKQRDTRKLEEKSLYEQSFIQCQYLWEDFPDIRGLTFHPQVVAMPRRYVRNARAVVHDRLVQGGRRPRNRSASDQPYWPIAERDTVTIWTAISEVDAHSGCMGYVPGSHLGEAEFIDIFNTPGDGKRLQEKFASTPPVFVPCSPGDAIFHSGFTVHMAKAISRIARASLRQRSFPRRMYSRIHARASIVRSHRNSDGRHGMGVPDAIDCRRGRRFHSRPWPYLARRSRSVHVVGIIPRS